MKMRIGFVSNSSSSSFIVVLPTDFELTIANIQKIMYGDEEQTPEYYSYKNDPKYFDTKVLAEWVCNEIKTALESQDNDEDLLSQLGAHIRDTNKELGSDAYFKHAPTDWKNKEQVARFRAYTNEIDAKVDELARKALEALKLANKDKNILVLNFGDDSSIGAQLEHSGILEEAFGAIRISNH